MLSVYQAINVQVLTKLFDSVGEVVFQFDESVLDEKLNLIQVTKYEQSRGGSNPRLGDNADIWLCETPETAGSVQLVLSQPYKGWHELCYCYTASEWTLLNRVVEDRQGQNITEASKTETEPFAFARLKKGDSQFAYLLYSAVTPQGKIVNPPLRPGRLGLRFDSFLTGLIASDESETEDVIMLQMFISSPRKLKAEEIEALSDDFVNFRSAIRDDVLQKTSGTPDANSQTSSDQNSHGSTESDMSDLSTCADSFIATS